MPDGGADSGGGWEYPDPASSCVTGDRHCTDPAGRRAAHLVGEKTGQILEPVGKCKAIRQAEEGDVMLPIAIAPLPFPSRSPYNGSVSLTAQLLTYLRI